MMRIHLQAKPSLPFSSATGARDRHVPVSVTIKPTNNVLGSFEYQTDSGALLQFLKRKTDLSGPILDAFRADLEMARPGRLPSVNLHEEVLQEMGYFID